MIIIIILMPPGRPMLPRSPRSLSMSIDLGRVPDLELLELLEFLVFLEIQRS